jgi:hypothetical protein
MPDVTLDSILIMRFPDNVKRALRRAAKAEGRRSMSALALAVLSEWLTGRGYLVSRGKAASSPKRRKRT